MDEWNTGNSIHFWQSRINAVDLAQSTKNKAITYSIKV
jgi:hypothetical protein